MPSSDTQFNKNTPTSFKNMTQERQREIAIMGSKASKEAARKRKTMLSCMRMLLEMKTTEGEEKVLKNAMPGLVDDDFNKLTLICAALIQKAAKGDTKAAGKIMELLGEKKITLAGDPDAPLVQSDLSIEKLKEIKGLIDKE